MSSQAQRRIPPPVPGQPETPPVPNPRVAKHQTRILPSRRDVLRGGALLALTTACGVGTLTRDRQPNVAATDAHGPVAYAGAQVYRSGAFAPATVIVEGGRITAVTEPASADAAGAEPFDAGGLWLIPGFIDAHVHLQFADADDILAGGVTTVRDLGSPPDVAADAGRTTPLRVLTAGRILTPVGGYPSRSWGSDGTSREISDAADAADAVAEQRDAGASLIKVALEPAGGPLFSDDVLQVIVESAHDAGLPVTAHVGSATALAQALEQGVDELAHLPLHAVTGEEMQRAAEAGVVLVPTLEIRDRDVPTLEAVGAFLSGGGSVVYGTDLGNTGTAPGIERNELRALLDAGMSPSAALDAATSVAADHLGLADVGRIEAGAAADLVGLRGDPLADVGAYDAVALVVAGGARVVG